MKKSNIQFKYTSILFSAIILLLVISENKYSVGNDFISLPQTVNSELGTLEVPSGALFKNDSVVIINLSKEELPPLENDLVNVTRGEGGIRCLPDGLHFKNEVNMFLYYDEKLIPEGYTANDIRTYYYDEERKKWMQIPFDRIIKDEQLIASVTDHFTDFINGIIKKPDAPETNAYTPTSIKDLKAADPSSEIVMIDAPEANQLGNANIHFSLKVPAGRNGLQPSESFSYNSESGNGWMGLGWNSNQSSISIETRWGVPKYDKLKETETYNLNGIQLWPLSHRSTPVDRTSEKRFYPRKEGDFSKIIRHGDSPTNYWWEVTDKQGVVSRYGGDSNGINRNSILLDDEGNIAQWMLTEKRDLNDNFISYSYQTISNSGVTGSENMGRNIYLDEIKYTGHGTIKGDYSVKYVLGKENTRNDIQINCRLGFKQVSAHLLDKVEIRYKEELIRSYKLDYEEGLFFKSLLKSIKEIDLNGDEFYAHEFEYFKDIEVNDKTYTAYQPADNLDLPNDNLRAGLKSSIIDFNDGVSNIGGGFSTGLSYGASLTVGPPGTAACKTWTLGGNYSRNSSDSQGLLALVDIDGDGLPDKVFKKGGSLYYRKHQVENNLHYYSDDIQINGINNFSVAKTKGNTKGVEANLKIIALGASKTKTETRTTTYLTDFNADGLIDIAHNGRVYFNQIISGIPNFVLSSENTFNPVTEGTTLDKSLFEIAPKEYELLIDENPLHDVVRVWKAPYDGTVEINAPVSLVNIGTTEFNDYSKKDGVNVKIQFQNQELWDQRITVENIDRPFIPQIQNLDVNKGDHIYFRVQSVFNGAFDVVNWDPRITYLDSNLDAQMDANGKSLTSFQASEDFLLSTPQSVAMPLDGKIKIECLVSKPRTSDNLSLVITKDDEILYEEFMPWDQIVDVVVDESFEVDSLNEISVKIQSATNIDWSSLETEARIYYTEIDKEGFEAFNDDLEPIIDMYPQIGYSMYNENYGLQDGSWTSNSSDSILISPFNLPAGTMINGEVCLSVKGVNKLYGKKIYKLNSNGLSPSGSFKVLIPEGEKVFIEYHAQDDERNDGFKRALFEALNLGINKQLPVRINNVEQKTNVFFNIQEPYLGPLYRGWGFFAWNGNRENAEKVIERSKLKVERDESIENNSDIPDNVDDLGESDGMNDIQFIMLYPDSSLVWRGFDRETWVTDKNISSSRFGEDDITIDFGIESTTGMPAPRKVTKNISNNFSAGVDIVLASANGSKSNGKTSFSHEVQDNNGDGYPDIISKDKTQFTNATGGYEELTVYHGLGVQRGESNQEGVSLSGSPMNAKSAIQMIKNSGSQSSSIGKCDNSNANSDAARGTAKASAGISANFGEGDQHTIEAWIDINGDGLPDKILENGMVSLNIGRSFLKAEKWDFNKLQDSQSKDYGGGANLGVNYHDGSFMAGIGLSRSESESNLIWQDINGDGLVDILNKNNDGVQVRLNLGNTFSEPLSWFNPSKLSESVSIGESFNAAATYCQNFLFFRVCFNGNFATNKGANRQKDQIVDFDGDGFPDFIQSNSEEELIFRKSTIGRSNLLKKVSCPLQSSFTLDYDRKGNTLNQPHNQWVLSTVEKFDGFEGDGVDNMVTSFEYEDGYYDRRERDFFGYKKVISTQLDTENQNEPYRITEQTYLNDNFINKGLLVNNTTKDANNNTFLESVNTYKYKNLNGDFISLENLDENTVYFPALVQTDELYYEGKEFAGLQTRTKYEHDLLGNVIFYAHSGNGTQEDLLESTITYHDIESNYIKGIPSSISVLNGTDELRYREALIEPNTGNVITIKQYLDQSVSINTDLEYYPNGNLKMVTNPRNHKGERMWYAYEYDPEISTFVTKVTDAYGYSSSSSYEYLFGNLLETEDLNLQKTKYSYDEKGRLLSLTGPYELEEGKEYTIAHEYFPDADVPYAISRNYDPEHDNDIVTATFIDGLKRPIQIKKTGSIFAGPGLPDKEVMIVSGRIHFDAFGRTVSSWHPITETIGSLSKMNLDYDEVEPTITSFDILDRQLEIKLPDNSITKNTYDIEAYNLGIDAFSTTVVDAEGNIRQSFKDVRDRNVAMMALGPDGEIWTNFYYNAISELMMVEDDDGNQTKYTYDNLGRKLMYDHPDGGKTLYTYDNASNKIGVLTAEMKSSIGDEATINYTYDYERLVKIDYPKNFQNKVEYIYGEPGESHNRAGRITLQIDASGGHEFYYGPLGEIVKEIRSVLIGPKKLDTYVWETKYDTWNRVQSMKYPDGEEIDYVYNNAGKIHSMNSEKGQHSYKILDQIGYDEFEEKLYMKQGNGTETNYTYDEKRRWMTKVGVTALLGRQIMNCNYEYDKMANITKTKNDIVAESMKLGGPIEQDYVYDELYRLKKAIGKYANYSSGANYSLQMEYDNTHKILRKTQSHQKAEELVLATSYDNQYQYEGGKPHTATKIGNRNFTYDANGNMTGFTTENHFSWRRMDWDEENRLTALSDNGLVSRYTYNASGERAVKSTDGSQSVSENGAPLGFISHGDNYTAYISPYLVAKENRFTKHYFIEGQRVASRIGTGKFQNRYLNKNMLTAGNYDYSVRAQMLLNSIYANHAAAEARPGVPTLQGLDGEPETTGSPHQTTDDYGAAFYTPPTDWVHPDRSTLIRPGIPTGAPLVEVDNSTIGAGYGFMVEEDKTEGNQYFFHSDHLGSASYVTDKNGEVRQHLEYMPFGETFVEEVNSQSSQDYLFTGKEVDRETGLYYYGARYYDPQISLWASVDPLAEKYPNISPFAYVANNPIINIDPDGRRIVTVHGTWSNPKTWKNLGGITRASSNLFGDSDYGSSFKWGGGNYSRSRTKGAKGLLRFARSQMKKESFNGQITFVGHSHGGNVAIEAINMMDEMEEFDQVGINLLTINTPVRNDYQLSESASKRVNHVNVYDSEDPVQISGGNRLKLLSGEYGKAGRVFQNAKNISVNNPQGLVELKYSNRGEPIPYKGDFHNSHNNVSSWLKQTE